jgi:hypothetical protein
MAKGDFVEVLVDARGRTAKEYEVRATRAGRRVEVKTSRSTVEISELTRNGGVVRTANSWGRKFMAPRVLAGSSTRRTWKPPPGPSGGRP